MPPDFKSDLSKSAAHFRALLDLAKAEKVPVIALRPDHRFPDELDDVVIKNVDVHFEAMSDDCFWMACTFENGEEVVFHFTIGTKPKRLVVTCSDKPSEYRDWDDIYRAAFRSPVETDEEQADGN